MEDRTMVGKKDQQCCCKTGQELASASKVLDPSTALAILVASGGKEEARSRSCSLSIREDLALPCIPEPLQH